MKHIHSFRLLALATVFSAAAFSVGCSDQDSRSDGSDNQAQLEPVMGTIDDDRIVAAIRADYFSANDVKAENIDVTSEQGVVTLSGAVPSDEVRQRAVTLARNADGVSTVNDRLQVQEDSTRSDRTDTASAQPSPEDSSGMVTTKILAQYYLNPQLKPWNIDVTTSRDGVVTLEGRIDNDKDREEAVRIAKSTDGVQDVRDRLRADDVAATAGTTASAEASQLGTDLSDTWITTKIRSRFFIDPDIKARDISVDTKDGVVVLRGTVGSYSARRQAVSTARNTDGVHEVQDELRVDSAAAGDPAGRASRAAGAVDDAWLTTSIQSKFFGETDLRSSGIDVSSRDGVVTLKGTVVSTEAKDSAVQLARDTDGVRTVRDQLTVRNVSDAQQR